MMVWKKVHYGVWSQTPGILRPDRQTMGYTVTAVKEITRTTEATTELTSGIALDIYNLKLADDKRHLIRVGQAL